MFGPRLQSTDLFDVNRFYVLRIQFAKHGQVEESAIEPRFYYADAHPNWAQPDDFAWLTPDQLTELLSKLARLRPFGRLVRPYSGVVFVTNLTGPLTDEYENALV